ncbi:hypothetical protein [Winogradskyella haliclonae]|uniref:DUF3278 domain-containing protein n=1 Tax=Winogradskyella haliclonae TaxID=2048558 RepID=A0ABQ2BYS5_9FLAO|nr:hypothetical protein [Winogradskyella haliclonae]GGI57666.1 hypothetical protein GCM10011444_19750 [Winogradskyella haliclonae]
MENDSLNKLWQAQNEPSEISNVETILNKAKQQRNGQYISITVMSVTVVILIAYTIAFATNQWNNFILGLLLMISSLVFRILLEFISMYRKKSQIILMSQKLYHAYLKKHYKIRLMVNYYITPICIAVYLYGFYLLLPYFKDYFSEGFYTYIVISGIISLSIIIVIIINSVIKERRFLKHLREV